MKTLSIPVRVVGPGSQPDEESLQYLDIPRDMNTFRMPLVPERVDPDALSEARDMLQEFLEALDPWDPAMGAAGPRIDISGLSPAAIDITDQMLGEGEVSIKIEGARKAHIQESVFAGIWRVCELDAEDRLIADWIEAASLPAIVLEAARVAAAPSPTPVAVPEGAMNSPALLNEIADRIRHRQPGHPAHVINLTLFPLTPEDHRVLEQALPVGPVGDHLARLRQLPDQFDAGAKRLARAVLQHDEHADPQHAGGRRGAGGRARRGRGSGRQPRTSRGAGRMDGRVVHGLSGFGRRTGR